MNEPTVIKWETRGLSSGSFAVHASGNGVVLTTVTPKNGTSVAIISPVRALQLAMALTEAAEKFIIPEEEQQ